MKWFFSDLAQNFAKFVYCFKLLWSNRKLWVMLISRERVNINGTRRLIWEVSYQYEFHISVGGCLHSPCTFSYPAAFVLLVRSGFQVTYQSISNDQSQQEETGRWINQNSYQLHVTCSKHGKNLARARCDWLCFSLLERLARGLKAADRSNRNGNGFASSVLTVILNFSIKQG